MCGRYFLLSDSDTIEAAFGVKPDVPPPPRYNISPGQPILIVRQDPLSYAPKREVAMVQWGFIPDWAKEPTVGGAGPFVNARSETVHEKASFKNAYRRRRCLVIADGFYEWQRTGKLKQPYRIDLGEPGLVAFAGLWELWQGPDGTEVETACMITRSAGPLMEAIHHREPVIIPPEGWDDWLHADERDMKVYGRWLDIDPPLWTPHPVSRDVGNVANDHAGLLDEVELEEAPREPKQGQLF
ncbi:SOS response-associated peptidase [Parvularcula flava]|uniref:Abasic site processing protein n=1 Tax=Aquisalinus luteolus TaxID=1566827 RepID=A0A8J3A444_9PROT|nr:SOS response-associated peptidase [Aquisalinus luteolus]NHK28963.1 SOS response-associated peptidase [Aquisalinus luteolus]GGI00726.1 DUF159 family protein [Aquisalinus luteolus]